MSTSLEFLEQALLDLGEQLLRRKEESILKWQRASELEDALENPCSEESASTATKRLREIHSRRPVLDKQVHEALLTKALLLLGYLRGKYKLCPFGMHSLNLQASSLLDAWLSALLKKMDLQEWQCASNSQQPLLHTQG